MHIDHVLYAVSDLEAGAARIESELALESIAGGEHPAWGTANRIVPLGADYLELIGVADHPAAAASDFGRLVLSAGDRLIGWAVATDDLDGVAGRLALEVQAGSRTRPDGVRLAWRLAGVPQALASGGMLPFFIHWDGPQDLHPGGDPSSGPGIAWIEVAGEQAALGEWLDGAELPVRFRDGESGIVAAAIGDVVLV